MRRFPGLPAAVAVLLPMACGGSTEIRDATVFDVESDPGLAREVTESPMTAQEYVASLSKGLAVDWSNTTLGREGFSEQVVVDFRARGLDHVRLRVKDDVDEALLAGLDLQIATTLRHGLKPILAYQAGDAMVDPSPTNRDRVVAWWRAVAEHFAATSGELAFDLLIEVSDALSDDADRLNEWYALLLAAVRETNPTRIVFVSPRRRSDPTLLSELVLPQDHRDFLAAEWHFYASGPTKDPANDTKRWTTGTPTERKLATDKIDAALAWQAATGIPTWVGAWMTGDTNRADSYTVDEQIVFCSFVVCALEAAGIPSALNADHLYYDAASNEWIEPQVAVLDVFLDPNDPNRVPCGP